MPSLRQPCLPRLFLFFSLFFSLVTLFAQTDPDPARWAEEIAAFDENLPEAPGPLFLFVGSSSIRMWDLDHSFPELESLNRGFGGSQISDLLHFFDRLIPENPHAVIFYAGDNDIAYGKSPRQVASDFRAFLQKLHRTRSETPLFFIAIKPSLARSHLMDEMHRANELIREYAETRPDLYFVDIEQPMLDENRKPRPELFIEDGLHLNAKGYALWSEILRRKLSQAGVLAPAADAQVPR